MSHPPPPTELYDTPKSSQYDKPRSSVSIHPPKDKINPSDAIPKDIVNPSDAIPKETVNPSDATSAAVSHTYDDVTMESLYQNVFIYFCFLNVCEFLLIIAHAIAVYMNVTMAFNGK